MNFTIREATSEDCEQICELCRQALEIHSEAHSEVFCDRGSSVFKDFVSQAFADENAVILCADHAGRIIGMAHVLVRESPDIPVMVRRRFAAVENVVVREGFRHKGVGKALMEAVHTWAQGKGLTRVELTVWAFNQDAIALYEKLGYEVVSSRMVKELGE